MAKASRSKLDEVRDVLAWYDATLKRATSIKDAEMREILVKTINDQALASLDRIFPRPMSFVQTTSPNVTWLGNTATG